MRKLIACSSLGFLLILASGCGGSGSGSAGGPTPTPLPTATPTPTPVPSPSPTPTPTALLLNSVSPSSAPAGSFTIVTLSGSGLTDNTLAELLGAGDLATEADSAIQIRAQVNPNSAAANFGIAVHVGSAVSNSLPFQILPAMMLIPNAATWTPGSAHTLRAKVTGTTTGSPVVWTTTGGVIDLTGTVDSATGFSFTTFTAPPSPGSFQITATSGTLSAVATVIVSATAGTFSSTGACSPHGQDFTITELPNGDIAILGGDNGNGVNELYHPSTNTCTTAAPFIEGRYQHSAEVITTGPNAGKLIACGGFLKNTSSELADCELYDPTLDSWSHGPSMALPRHNFAAATLPNGDLFFAGGRFDAKTEVYVAATGTFKAGCTMTAPRFLAGVGTLPSGNVLITGGATSDGVNTQQAVSSAELYKPASNTCVPVGHMLAARTGPNVNVLSDGRAVVSGTIIQGGENPAVEAFSEATLKFSVIGSKQLNTCCFSQSLLPSGQLLLSGGIWQSEVTGQSEIFDPVTGKSVGSDAQKTARFLQKTLTTGAGAIIEIGGHGVTAADPTTGEVYQQ